MNLLEGWDEFGKKLDKRADNVRARIELILV